MLAMSSVYGLSFVCVLAATGFAWILRHRKTRKRSVAIVVLGDIGRSPRMMYHAESFLNAGFKTYVVGYGGSKPLPSLRDVHLVHLPEPLRLPNLPFVLSAPLKVSHQVVTTLHALMHRVSPTPEFIMVQNPPSIPTLALVWIVGRLTGSKIIIDWHNLGYSVLALKLRKPNHPFVVLSKLFERVFGRSAYAHLFVTRAMHDHLVHSWGLKGRKAVLHDRPPRHFHKASPPEIHELFLRIRETLPIDLYTSFFPPSSPPYSTPFTHFSAPTIKTTTRRNIPTLRPDRPALLVSSTSWTPDEDFSILLDALCQYEQRARARESPDLSSQPPPPPPLPLPKILVVITGKGPLKDSYMRDVERLQRGSGSDPWRWVRCIDMWLEVEDYPLLLGSADLGVCLHSSSSALDLPMKIVDMFGCGLPVCALNFACLDELVKDGHNGRIFENSVQLADLFETLLTSFPESPDLAKLGSSFTTSRSDSWEWDTWEGNWAKVVLPLVS